MNDTELDAILRRAAPPVSAPVDLSAHRERILAEGGLRRRRRVASWSAAGIVTALVFGGGTAALAGYGIQTPWGWMADNALQISGANGSTCFQGMRIEFDGVSEDSAIVRDAREILRTLDIDSLDTTDDEAYLRKTDVAHTKSDAAWKQEAAFRAVAERLDAELEARGYSSENGSPIMLHGTREQCAE